MSANEPQDPFQDPDRTVLVPAPGGKRMPPAAAANPAASPATNPATNPATAAPEDATLTAPSATAPPRPSATNAPRVPVTLHGNALNPLVRAANPLLDLVTPLRHMTSYPNVEGLRIQLVTAIKTFEAEAKAARVEHEAIAAARYSLCTFLDETISSTPWGGGGVWASRSLLVTFHNEAFGGEKFFLILQKLGQDARANLHILELMYLCLALGLEGRYRVIEGGRAQLEILRERLQQLIQKQRGAFEPELSVHWKGASGKGEPLWRVIPVWVLAAIAAALFILLQLFFSFRLNQASDPVFAGLHQIKVAAPVAAPPPAPLPVAKPVRVAGFLAPEIARGLVSVNETADRSVVTLRGDGVFASGSAEVDRDFIPLLQRIGEALKPVPGKVIVIGHTDNVKAGVSARFPSNWDLSKGRANSVKALLAERAGPPERYAVEGRGDTEPLVANDSAANRARNRRVDIIVLTPALQP
ncbi:MAG: type IVB secretion system protein IcmH/DotU [Pseudomonadota bacterium]